KFDPIPTQDYYSLYGVFAASVEPKDLPLLEPPKRTPEVIAFEEELARREAAVDAFLKRRQAEIVAGLQSLTLLPGDDPVALRGGLLLGPELAQRFPAERLQRRFTVADRNRLVDLRNRVWGWHFGKGLVTTPSDFGVRSDPPSHPELLDWLAARFMSEGWSLKALHRTIMLSQVYQQSSGDRADGLKLDPENRLLWRFN